MNMETSDELSSPSTKDLAAENVNTEEVIKTVRELSIDEREKLAKDTTVVRDYKQQKFEQEAQKNWDLFYKRNTTKFFKDRHWTTREFSELTNKHGTDKTTVFEIGCGVGNFMFPLLETDTKFCFYACDFSKRAVQFVQDNPKYDASRCTAFHCDITQDDLSQHIPTPCVDVATLIFVLSALHPDKMVAALMNVYKVIKPGGCVLVRDYGLFDYAMLRFAPGHKLSENFYVRQDGTRAYYFSIDKLTEIMITAGFQVDHCDYIQRQTVNKKENLSVPRIFVQAKFVRPNVRVEELVTPCEDGENIGQDKFEMTVAQAQALNINNGKDGFIRTSLNGNEEEIEQSNTKTDKQNKCGSETNAQTEEKIDISETSTLNSTSISKSDIS